MINRTWMTRLLGAVAAMLCLAVSAHGSGTTYDLTGAWRLVALDNQQSFCDGSQTQEVVVIIVGVTQVDEFLTLVIPDPPNNQVFQGRTSNFFLALESNTPEATTVINGTVSPDATRISGTLVFYDKGGCPGAETGASRYQMTKIN